MRFYVLNREFVFGELLHAFPAHVLPSGLLERF
jgi:hypothetical protein